MIKLGIEQARADGVSRVGTEHLLHGLLGEGSNLALQVLRAVEIEPDHVARELARVSRTATNEVSDPPAERFSGPAANALELTVTEAVTLGHNYVGCEHLLLGLIAEPAGTGGQTCAPQEPNSGRPAGRLCRPWPGMSTSAQATAGSPAGPADAAKAGAAMVRQELQPLLTRIERLEEHLDTTADD